jgi:vacuolar-type H+-ATPase subunit C/Vma6
MKIKRNHVACSLHNTMQCKTTMKINKLKNALDKAHYELFSISLQASHVLPYAPLQDSTYGMAVSQIWVQMR